MADMESLTRSRQNEPEYRCEVCGKKTNWSRKKFCSEHAEACKHEAAVYSPTGDDVCNDCGAVW